MLEELEEDCEHQFEVIDQYNSYTIICRCDLCGGECQFIRD